MSQAKNKTYPEVAVVILAWNGQKFLELFLPPLLKTTYPAVTFYVADNASTDGTADWVRTNYPQVKVIALSENKGFAAGYNEALEKIDAPYYVLLNQDVEVTPDWIGPVIKMMEKDSKVAACQPKIKAFYQKSHFEYAGAAGGWIDRFGHTFCRGRIFDTIEEDAGQYDEPVEIFWASGACLFIRSELYHHHGGLDGDFFAHMEEIDLCWRLKNSGYKIMYCPDAEVFHVGGGSLEQGNPKKTYLNFRNSLKMLLKNLPLFHALWILPFRLILDHVAAYKALFAGNVGEYRAIASAHFDFFKRFRRWIIKRKKARKMALDPNPHGIYKGSVVWAYFFRQRKKFTEIGKSS